MGLFSKLRGKEKTVAPLEEEEVRCPHVTLTPHWDQPEDMGKDELASSFTCQACGQTFGPAEARMLRQTEAERLKRGLEVPEPSEN